MTLWQRLETDLLERERQNLRRELRVLPPDVFDLASNDYLGLARHPEVVEAACQAAQNFGAGARASRLVSGHTDLHAQLEAEIAAFKGAEAALVFPSGYHANLSVINAFQFSDAKFFSDRRNHASLIDAVQLTDKPARSYRSPERLRELLSSQNGQFFIVTDGVFSMDGDVCDLPELLKIAEEFDATILLDDAHGTGTLGATGRGTTEHFDLKSERIIEIGTLSKALGSQGGFVAGPRVLIEFLVNYARPFIYTTGLNPPAVGAALQALKIVQNEPQRLENLRFNTRFLSDELQKLGFDAPLQPSPIIPVMIGEEKRALETGARLLERGFWCPAIRPPTVKKGASRLRLTVCANWGKAELERIVAAFEELNSLA